MTQQLSFDGWSPPPDGTKEDTTQLDGAPVSDVVGVTRAIEPFRPIHYLGSKLRIAHSIHEQIDRVAVGDGPVCDLFAGSGSVASLLAASRPVTTVDIQEYSRVLCSAVLSPYLPACFNAEDFLQQAGQLIETNGIFEALRPIIQYEKDCIDSARNGDLDPLCELIENGSIQAFRVAASSELSTDLRKVLGSVAKRLGQADPEGRRSIATRYYGGVYFSYHQTMNLDALLSAIEYEDPQSRDTLLAAVLSCASQAVNTVGKQFAQPLRPRYKTGKPKTKILKKIESDRKKEVYDLFLSSLAEIVSRPAPRFSHRAIRDDYIDALKTFGHEFSAVYADPPYTRDHYSRFYHVLETLCLKDNPEVSMVRRGGRVLASRGIYRAERYQSPFCIRSKAPEAFNRLFETLFREGLPLVLSYSPHEADDGTHPRVISTEKLLELAKSKFRSVDLFAPDGITHSRLNSTAMHLRKRENAEILIICRP